MNTNLNICPDNPGQKNSSEKSLLNYFNDKDELGQKIVLIMVPQGGKLKNLVRHLDKRQ
mgnify:CR=1 FL=1